VTTTFVASAAASAI